MLDGVVALVDPCDAERGRAARAPSGAARDPVRGTATAATLRVRIYPDEIHVDDLVRGLTAEETGAGQAYWTRSGPTRSAERPGRLRRRRGADRAEWVAHASHAREPRRARTAPTPTSQRRRGARARAMSSPARCPIASSSLAIQGSQVSQAVGGPSRGISRCRRSRSTVTRRPAIGDALTVPPGSEWLVDYDRAVEVGMAVTVTLAAARRRSIA